MSKTVRYRGFTLPEVLVTITIIAVLAAVVVPAVLNQVGKGDDTAVAEDLIAVRTGITTFTSDTRKYPGDLTHLAGTSLMADSLDADSTAYGATAAAAYRGPYLSITTAHTNPTGAVFRNRLKVVASSVCLRDSVKVGTDTSLVSPTQAAQMDKVLDHGDGGAMGNVQYTVTAGLVDTGSFRACLVTK